MVSTKISMIMNTTAYISENATNDVTTHAPGHALQVWPVVLMFTFGVSGNGIAFTVLLKTARKHRWKPFFRLVATLTVVDFIGLVVALPISMATYLNDKVWIGGQLTCNLESFMFIFSGIVSALIACAMSVERYIALWFPFHYGKISRRLVNWIIFSIIASGIIFASLPMFGINENVQQFPGTWCFFNFFATAPEDRLFAIFYALLGILAILVMVICNSIVLMGLLRRCKASQRRKRSSSATVSKSKQSSDVINFVFLSVLLIIFSTCWVPMCARIMVNQISMSDADGTLDLIALRMTLINQILDPWIYILLRKDSIRAILRLSKRHSKPGSFLHRIPDIDRDTSSNDQST